MATDSSGELVVTTNLPTYTPYASSTRLFNALAVVATDGADLEITVTNSRSGSRQRGTARILLYPSCLVYG